MKKLIFISLCFIILSVSSTFAQDWDWAVSAGMMTTLQTGKFSNTTNTNSAGHSYVFDLQLNHTGKDGFIIGGDISVYGMRTGQFTEIPNFYYRVGPAKIIWGSPALSVDVIAGYKLRLKKSALSANARFGYLITEHIGNTKVSPYELKVYMDDRRGGYRYGADLEYQHKIGRAISVGLKLSPSFVHLPSNLTFFCFGSALSLHVKL